MQRIEQVQDYLGSQIVNENVSCYTSFSAGIVDAAFISQIPQRR